jgi:hypothetical protein
MASILRHVVTAVPSLFDRGFDPARARSLPVLNEAGESNVRGLYLAGEIAGTPLIKLGLNRGRSPPTRSSSSRSSGTSTP